MLKICAVYTYNRLVLACALFNERSHAESARQIHTIPSIQKATAMSPTTRLRAIVLGHMLRRPLTLLELCSIALVRKFLTIIVFQIQSS